MFINCARSVYQIIRLVPKYLTRRESCYYKVCHFLNMFVAFIYDGRVLSSSQICHANYHFKKFLVNFIQ